MGGVVYCLTKYLEKGSRDLPMLDKIEKGTCDLRVCTAARG